MKKNQGMEKQINVRSQNSPPTIAFLTDEGMSVLNYALGQGAASVIRERGANLVYFPGHPLRSPHGFESQANIIHDLIGPENVDGLIIFGGALAHHVDAEEMRRFYQQYAPLPIVSVALPLEGIPTVLSDNYRGMREAVTHLVEVHGCRRIAFVRGPVGHPEAEERYRAYVDVLAEHGIRFDPDLVAPGEFAVTASVQSGRDAIALLLEERRRDFEAIAASTDGMAFGVLEALQARDIDVPEDVALLGFDDHRRAKVVTPPLTTARQPMYEIGRRAAEILLAQLAGEEVPEEVFVSPPLVVRQSCGCLLPQVARAAAPSTVATGESFADALAAGRERILTAMAQAVEPLGLDPDWPEELLDAFAAGLKEEAQGRFLAILNKTLHRVAATGGDVKSWQGMISALRHQALPYLADDGDRFRAENLWQQARVLIGEVARRAEIRRWMESEQRARALRETGDALITTFHVEALMDIVAQELPQLGIPSCYLSLYERPGSIEEEGKPPEESRLILAYNEMGRVPLESDGRLFPSRQLLPLELLPDGGHDAVTIEPLYFRENQIGFVIFEVGPEEATVCGTLRRQLSSALQGALLVQQVERRAVQLQTAAEVSHAASSILDLDELIEGSVELARERFDLYYAGLFLVDQTGQSTNEPGRWAVLRAGTGEAGQEMLARGHKLEIGGSSMIGWCVANKQARIALDVGEEAVRFENPLLPKTHSELALPLITRGEAIGALTIQSSQKAAFSREDISVLQTMADQLANAIDSARLLGQTEVHTKELTVLYELSQALAARLSVDQVVEEIYQYLSRLLDTTNFYVGLYDPEKEEVTFPFNVTESTVDRHITILPADQGITGYIINNRTSVLIEEDLTEWHKERGMEMIGEPALSWLGVPLTIGDQVLGVMAVQSYNTPRKYSEHDRDMMTAVASQAAIAIQNARLFEQTQDALRELKSIHRRYLEQEWSEYLEYRTMTSYETVRPGVSRLDEAVLPEVQRAEEEGGTVLTSGDEGRKKRTAMVTPITVRGAVIGALGIHDDRERQWTEDEIALVEAVAERMAMAAENVRLFDETQLRASHERMVSEITGRMRETLDMETVLKVAADEIYQALGLKEVVIRLATEGTDSESSDGDVRSPKETTP